MIKPFNGEEDDRELNVIAEFLERSAVTEDVRPVINNFVKHGQSESCTWEINATLLANMKQKSEGKKLSSFAQEACDSDNDDDVGEGEFEKSSLVKCIETRSRFCVFRSTKTMGSVPNLKTGGNISGSSTSPLILALGQNIRSTLLSFEVQLSERQLESNQANPLPVMTPNSQCLKFKGAMSH